MGRCVIVGGADIKRYDIIKKLLRSDDYYIFCDCGLKHLEKIGVRPDLIVGDFDSYDDPEVDIETIILPREKDDTDSVFAVKTALKRGFDDFLLVGVAGNRLDHTLGNVSILAMLNTLGKSAKLIDDFSEMTVVDKNVTYVDDTFSYFSILNIFGEASGINIRNAKYPLENAVINCEYQYGISNEVLENRCAEINVENGRLLLICVR